MEKTPLVGLMVVVHDRGRPQAGRAVHPAVITQVESGSDGLISVRVLPENGVDYPIKNLNYMHGKGYVEGLSWRWPEDSTTVQTEDGEVRTPDPQATSTPTPGVHEPRNVGGIAVAKPGEAPNKEVGEGTDTGGEGSEAAKAAAGAGDADAAAGGDETKPADAADKPADAAADAKPADPAATGTEGGEDPFADLGGTVETKPADAAKGADAKPADKPKK